MAKEFLFYGKKFEEVEKMSINEFAALLPARERRSLVRGMPEEHKKILTRLKNEKKIQKTHCRDMIILPEMVGKMIKVYTGKEFIPLRIINEMMGHRLGEFAITRKSVAHSSPGIGATRSSAALSVR